MKKQLAPLTASPRFILILPMLALVGCGSGLGNSNNPRNPHGEGPAAVSLSASGVDGDLGAAAGYVILAKTGLSNVTGSAVTGNIGVSPAASTYITGFTQVADSSNTFSTAVEVVGKIYAATFSSPTPSNLTTAIGSMETAYTEAAGRNTPDFNELAAGNLGGLTLTPGLYTWTNTVTIPTSFTISGGPNDIWIFQVAGNLTMSSAKSIILSGGARAQNIFWQVAGQVTIEPNSHFEGIILSKTAVTLQTNASMSGRIFAQSRVNLDNNVVTQP